MQERFYSGQYPAYESIIIKETLYMYMKYVTEHLPVQKLLKFATGFIYKKRTLRGREVLCPTEQLCTVTANNCKPCNNKSLHNIVVVCQKHKFYILYNNYIQDDLLLGRKKLL
jgi:hypothetical protein